VWLQHRNINTILVASKGRRHVALKGGRGRRVGYWWESQKEINHWEDQDIGGRIILNGCRRDRIGRGFDWIGLAQDKEKWRDFVNLVMNLRVP
jgi:hypothetical protein